MTSNYHKTRLIVLLCLAICIPGSLVNAQYYSTPNVDRPLISVTGEAEVRVTPDIVVIVLNVETMDQDLSTSKAKNDAIIKKINKITKDYKLEKKRFRSINSVLIPGMMTTENENLSDMKLAKSCL